MKSSHDSVTRITSAIAVVIAVFISIVIPAFYFAVSYQYTGGSMDAQAELTAKAVGGIVMANSQTWRFEEIRLEELLARRHAPDMPEKRLIRDMQGKIVAQIGESISAPLITRGYNIYDSGSPVARVDLSRSLMPLIIRTGIVGSFSFLFGIMIFVVLRTIPLRAVRKAYLAAEGSEQALRENKEFLEALIEAAPT